MSNECMREREPLMSFWGWTKQRIWNILCCSHTRARISFGNGVKCAFVLDAERGGCLELDIKVNRKIVKCIYGDFAIRLWLLMADWITHSRCMYITFACVHTNKFVHETFIHFDLLHDTLPFVPFWYFVVSLDFGLYSKAADVARHSRTQYNYVSLTNSICKQIDMQRKINKRNGPPKSSPRCRMILYINYHVTCICN